MWLVVYMVMTECWHLCVAILYGFALGGGYLWSSSLYGYGLNVLGFDSGAYMGGVTKCFHIWGECG